MDYLLLLVGFALLVKGADILVVGSSGIAKYFKIPSLLIGLTIVAFGTSAPEAAVSISATIAGNNGIAIGNVLGSNIFNTSLILGLAAFLYPIRVELSTIKKEIPLTLIAALLLFIFALDPFLGDSQVWLLSRSEAMVLLIFFGIFMYYVLESAAISREAFKSDSSITHKPQKLSKDIVFTLLGLGGVILGGKLVVDSSVNIAEAFGLSQTLIGLTIVAIGTSLPELVTSCVAAYKKESDIAVGNVVGSNIFNILFILGISGIIKPIPIDTTLFYDLILNIALTVLLLIFSITGRKIVRKEGIALVLIYVGYTVYLVMTNM